jgi:hypothetical protein
MKPTYSFIELRESIRAATSEKELSAVKYLINIEWRLYDYSELSRLKQALHHAKSKIVK